MAYSPDGITWTALSGGTGGTSTFESSVISGIAWGGTSGNQKFVAVGLYGKMAYSADGVTWTAIPAGTGAGTSTFGTSDVIKGIAWGGPAGSDKFVAVGYDSSYYGKIAWSTGVVE